MATLAEPIGAVEPDVVEALIVRARIADPEIVGGRILGGRIVGGRIVDVRESSTKSLHALHIDAEHRRTEIVAIIGLGLALLLMYLF
jgi:hypothetical protein